MARLGDGLPENLPENSASMSILVVVDHFSKMVHLIPLLSSTEAKDGAAAFFDSVFIYMVYLPQLFQIEIHVS